MKFCDRIWPYRYQKHKYLYFLYVRDPKHYQLHLGCRMEQVCTLGAPRWRTMLIVTAIHLIVLIRRISICCWRLRSIPIHPLWVCLRFWLSWLGLLEASYWIVVRNVYWLHENTSREWWTSCHPTPPCFDITWSYLRGGSFVYPPTTRTLSPLVQSWLLLWSWPTSRAYSDHALNDVVVPWWPHTRTGRCRRIDHLESLNIGEWFTFWDNASLSNLMNSCWCSRLLRSYLNSCVSVLFLDISISNLYSSMTSCSRYRFYCSYCSVSRLMV